jgi:hypothetical protein
VNGTHKKSSHPCTIDHVSQLNHQKQKKQKPCLIRQNSVFNRVQGVGCRVYVMISEWDAQARNSNPCTIDHVSRCNHQEKHQNYEKNYQNYRKNCFNQVFNQEKWVGLTGFRV